MSRWHKALDRKKWERVRIVVLERAAWRCEKCGKAGRLEVDHRDPLSKFPDQDPFDLLGLQALCRPCHLDKSRGDRGEDPERAAWRALVAEIANS